MSSVKQHFMDSFLYPKSVAVVGATRDEKVPSFNLLANLIEQRFKGAVYPVNPNTSEILGLTAYPNLKSIKGDVDLAVIAVSARIVPGIIKDCVDKGVKAVAIVSGGFAEIGEEGKRIQDEVLSLLKPSGIRAIGPNALSPINTKNHLAISFHIIDKLTKGKVSFIFQSGVYEPRLNWLLSGFNLGINKLIDLGNKMDINEVEVLDYLAQDLDTGVIAMHMESIAGDARAFMQLLRDTTTKKPVIILKSGRTEAGAKAASSHTGAITKSSDIVFDTVLKQSGAIRAQSLEEFFDLAKVFEYLPLPKGNRVVVSSGSGGLGVLATDVCHTSGLEMAQFSESTYEKLRSVYPPWDISGNPFDTGLCSNFHEVTEVYDVLLRALANEPDVDCLAIEVSTGPLLNPDKLAQVASIVVKGGKPMVMWVPDMGQKNAPEITQHLESKRVPVFPSAERAIKALAGLYQHELLRSRL
ncbi:acetate--CoA ligase family protein [Chloroflexota bacterium]